MRVESLLTPPTSGELMQHELFDFTAMSEGDADEAPFAAFASRQEVVAATHDLMAPWTEDQLLELVKSMSAMRTIRQQPRALRQCASAILRKPSPASFLLSHSIGQARRP